jgi:hypothetical protein
MLLYTTLKKGDCDLSAGNRPEPYEWIELSYGRLEKSGSGEDRMIFFFDGRDARAVPSNTEIKVGDRQTHRTTDCLTGLRLYQATTFCIATHIAARIRHEGAHHL